MFIYTGNCRWRTLDLTRFQTPDPWSAIYAREALGVKTWDVYDLVLGAYGGKIEKILSIEWNGRPGRNWVFKSRADRFPPVVKFLGPLLLKRTNNTHTILIPRYVGSVKNMVIAGNQKAYDQLKKWPCQKSSYGSCHHACVLGPGKKLKCRWPFLQWKKTLKKVEVEIGDKWSAWVYRTR